MAEIIGFRGMPVEPPGTRLRRLAGRITTAEQFQAVLNDVDGPEGLREAVRTMLLPFLPDQVRAAVTADDPPGDA